MGGLFTRELVIEADGPWIAQVGARSTRTIEGTGNRTIPAELRTGYCWSVQQKGSGALTVYIKDAGITERRETTTVPHGVVSGCYD